MKWTVFLVGLLLAGLGSAGAAALVTAARSDLSKAISRRLRGADESFEWLAETENLVVVAMALSSLGVALIGVTIPAIFGSATLGQLGALLLFLVVPAMLLVGYLLPRWLTRPRAQRTVSILRPPLEALGTVLRVVLPSGVHATTQDVQAIAREGSASGLGTGEELALVGGVMSFAELPIRGVMTPRTDVVAVAQDLVRSDVFELFTKSGYSRLPVYRESLDEIVGMVHAFDLFKLAAGDPLPIRPVVHAPETLPAANLLVKMQRERRHFAVVLDEFGGTAGIVTLEDLLEALVGEISDEDDGEVVVTPGGAAVLEVVGSEPLSLLVDRFGIVIPDAGATTIAGILVEKLGRIPISGERFSFAGIEFDVLDATPTRISRMLIRQLTTQTIPLDRESE